MGPETAPAVTGIARRPAVCSLALAALLALAGAGCRRKTTGVPGTSRVSSTPLAPTPAADIELTARRWLWAAQYPGGQPSGATPGEVLLPAGRPVRLALRSRDVTHRLEVPSLGLDVDVGAGAPTTRWIEVARPGVYRGVCHEDCRDHPDFALTVRVVPPEEFAQRTQAAAPPPTPEAGARLFARLNCGACHGDAPLPHSPIHMPLRGLWGAERIFADGSSLRVEGPAGEQYLRESITAPGRRVVSGYSATTMPSYAGQLNDAELAALVAHLRCSGAASCAEPGCAGAALCPQR